MQEENNQLQPIKTLLILLLSEDRIQPDLNSLFNKIFGSSLKVLQDGQFVWTNR